MRATFVWWLAVSICVSLILPGSAIAYVGPGVGLTALGAALAFIAAIVLAIAGFIWYPIKRLWRAQRARRARVRTSAGTIES